MTLTPPETALVTAASRLYVTAEERRRFIAAARAYERTDVATFAATLAYTGCRISEALAVRAADVDLVERTIRFRTLKRRVEHWREVPLPDGAHPRARPPAPCRPAHTPRHPASVAGRAKHSLAPYRRTHAARRH